MNEPEFLINQEAFQEFQALIQQVEDTETDSFTELAKLLGRNLKTDFAGADLSGTDLSFSDLGQGNFSGTDFSGADLRNANLVGANLSGANFEGANLSNANLSHANLIGANFNGADLTKATLKKITREPTNLEGAILEGAILAEQTLIVQPGDGRVVISNFKAISSNTEPDAIPIIDSLRFSGAGLTAENMVLTQRDDSLIITFDQTKNIQVVLENFSLYDLDTLSNNTAISITRIGNIVFDSFDILDSDYSQVDTIYSLSGDNDVLRGLSGDNDVLIGGAGHDILIGDIGRDTFILSSEETCIIQDFNVQLDTLQLSRDLSINQIEIAQGKDGTVIIQKDTGKLLAVLQNIQISSITIKSSQAG